MMKQSIRTRFTTGMIFLFMIILVLSVFSGYYLNKMSDKTDAILKENYLSVVYARDMTEGITYIDREIITAYFSHSDPDSLKIGRETDHIGKSLSEAKNNITEPGEEKLILGIEGDYGEFKNTLGKFHIEPISAQEIPVLQSQSAALLQKLSLLSQINGNAIESKTDAAKSYSNSALTKMTVLASLCFLIGLGFTFSFSEYFRKRFFQLYSGIKEIAANNFDRHLYFYEQDEFYEISLIFNEMADKLRGTKQKLSVNLPDDTMHDVSSDDLNELKNMLFKIKLTEEQTAALISKIEKRIESNEP